MQKSQYAPKLTPFTCEDTLAGTEQLHPLDATGAAAGGTITVVCVPCMVVYLSPQAERRDVCAERWTDCVA